MIDVSQTYETKADAERVLTLQGYKPSAPWKTGDGRTTNVWFGVNGGRASVRQDAVNKFVILKYGA